MAHFQVRSLPLCEEQSLKLFLLCSPRKTQYENDPFIHTAFGIDLVEREESYTKQDECQKYFFKGMMFFKVNRK